MPNPHSVEAAIAWVDAAVHCLDGEDVRLRAGRGRVLARGIRAVGPIPAGNCAARDGFAHRGQIGRLRSRRGSTLLHGRGGTSLWCVA